MNPHLHAVPGIDENGEVTHSWPTTLPECWRLLDEQAHTIKLQAGTMAELEDHLETETWGRRSAKSEMKRYRNRLAEHHKEEERSDQVREVLTYWRDRCAPKAELPEDGDRWEKVRDRLGLSDRKTTTRIVERGGAGYTVEELKLAVDGALRSDFHCGINDKGKVYLDAVTLFGNSGKTQKHIDRERATWFCDCGCGWGRHDDKGCDTCAHCDGWSDYDMRARRWRYQNDPVFRQVVDEGLVDTEPRQPRPSEEVA